MQDIRRVVATVVLLMVAHLYFYSSEHIKKMDYFLYDFMSKFTQKFNKHEEAFYSVVVEIDEKTLQLLGQWPLPRVVDAELIDALHEMKPTAIGVNILFAEPDRVSPLYLQQFYKNFFDLDVNFKMIPKSLKDNDQILSEALLRANATLSTYFNNEALSSKECDALVYEGNRFSREKTTLHAGGFLCNYLPIQQKSKNFGFVNAWSDNDGVFRRVPLWMEYHHKVFPSFALATLLSFDKSIQIDREESNLLVNYSEKRPKVFSAIDILRGQVPQSEIQGKIVILGVSVAGVTSNLTIPNGEEISNSMLNAIAIDNMLTQSYLQQPSKYKKVNLLLSFLLLLGLSYLLFKRAYEKLVIVWMWAVTISFLLTTYFYIEGLYLSLGYLLLPLCYSFLVIFLYHIKVLSNEKHQQEKLLIKQSKLASMGEMITLIAHQWRQPLSAINGIVLNLDIDYRKNRLQGNRFDDHLTNIENTTAYLSKTINDFTDFFSTKKRADQFYLEDVIKQTMNLSSLTQHKEVDVIYDKSKRTTLYGCQSELTQSLLILLNNALYACLENLSLTKRGEIYINTYLKDKFFFIDIEDNGGGIEASNLYKIFDPYFTTKDESSGTGLGLYILKLIVEDSINGKVKVKNTKEGALFRLQLPLTIFGKPD